MPGLRPPPAYGQPPPGYPSPPNGQSGGPRSGIGKGSLIAIVSVVAIVIAAVVVMVVLRGDDKGSRSAAPSTTPALSAPSSVPSSPAGAGAGASTVPAAKSAVTGRIADSTVGISYARLGSPWTPADSGWLRPDYFSAGQVSVVQAPFEQYANFNATSLSGPLRPDESVGYSGPSDLPVVGKRVVQRILGEHFNLANRMTPIFAGSYQVAGRQAWLDRFRLDFTEAKARDWKFSADTVAIMVVDIGGRRAGLLWVSVPDTFPHQGDIDQVLTSVKVP